MAARRRRAARTGLVLGLLLASLAMVGPPVAAQAREPVTVRGRLTVGEGLSLADAGAIVVFLEAADPAPSPAAPSLPGATLPPAVVRQSGAEFEPAFLVVSRGQRVEMPNDDVIYHNVFSYSDPNEFDLGMYPSGQSRSVRFEHSGLVRIYCSIHEDMDGLIFVAPSPLYTVPHSTGDYSIPGVPPGVYRLHVWSERLPEIVSTVEAGNAPRLAFDVLLGPTSAD